MKEENVLNQAGQAIVGAGQAQAAGRIGQANAWQNTIGNLSSLYGMYMGAGGGSPNYALNAPAGGSMAYVPGGYGGTGMGVWYQ